MPAERPLQPGSPIGILGGGQLGRMLALAAARLGLPAHIYCQDKDEPAAQVAAAVTLGSFADSERIAAFARSVKALTIEFENIPVAALETAALHTRVHPSANALSQTQDRLIEKHFVAGLGIPVAPFEAVGSPEELGGAIARIGLPSHLKTRRFGYDGKGQLRLEPGADPAAAFIAIGGVPAILEGHVPFACEVSVIAVRAADGSMAFYDPPRNRHEGGILRRSVVPSGLPLDGEARARAHACAIADALGYVGVLGVEMFWCGADAADPLIVNEIAPRVHNSGHWTLDACPVSQFENHIRAVAGWPLGTAERHSDAVMDNLIGEEAHSWPVLAAESGACVHLYGKMEARAGRKMGHVTRIGACREERCRTLQPPKMRGDE